MRIVYGHRLPRATTTEGDAKTRVPPSHDALEQRLKRERQLGLGDFVRRLREGGRGLWPVCQAALARVFPATSSPMSMARQASLTGRGTLTLPLL